MKQIVVIGLGNFGGTIAEVLAAKGCQVMAIDINRELIQKIKDKVTQAVLADASDKEVLKSLGLENADIAVVSLGDRIDLSILVTLFLRDIGVKKIYVKAISEDHGKALKLIGADRIFFPEKDEAHRVANSLINADIMEYIYLSEEYSIIELNAPPSFVGKTLQELDIRRRYKVQVFGIRDSIENKVKLVPDANYKIKPEDTLIIIGENVNLEKFKEEIE